jgi:hypothetical protein
LEAGLLVFPVAAAAVLAASRRSWFRLPLVM